MARPERALLLMCALALVAACPARGGSTALCPAAAVDVQAQALYAADAEPNVVQLDARQRLAVVSIYGPGGPELGLCTGTLVAPRWVLTAAHCQALPATQIAFGADAFDPLLRSSVVRAVQHPMLDLMLLELAQPELVAALGIGPLAWRVSPDEDALRSEHAQLAGFGLTEGGAAGRLLFADEPIIDVDAQALKVDGAQAGGACLGDSGGPLLVAQDGEPVLIGALSSGAADCQGIDRYTRLAAAWPWLAAVIDQAPALDLACDAHSGRTQCVEGHVATSCESGQLRAADCTRRCVSTDMPQSCRACSAPKPSRTP